MQIIARSSGHALICVVATLGQLLAKAADQVEVSYKPSDAVLTNPERGLYKQFTAYPEGRPLSRRQLESLCDKGMTLLLRMYYLDSFRHQDLSEKQLRLINQDFDTIRRAGCKCILRFAYCSEIGQTDAPLESVLRHIEQLQPLLRENVDIIALMQAGFIGPWGEWHSSTNNLDTPEGMRAISHRLLSALPSTRFVQVRTPRYKRTIVGNDRFVGSADAFLDSPLARLGHHNDCFLADETDLGTYDPDRIKWDKNYLAHDTRYVTMGGETCSPSAYTSVENARREMKQMHWTYLHRGFHPAVLDDWERTGFLDEVEQLLGYRLTLLSTRGDSGATKGGAWKCVLKVQNFGWAAPFNPREVVIVFKSAQSNSMFKAKLPVDPRRWLPIEPITVKVSLGIPDSMPAGKYRLHLMLPDPEPRLQTRPDYCVQLANEGLWDANTGMHDLEQDVVIVDADPAKRYSGKLWLEKLTSQD